MSTMPFRLPKKRNFLLIARIHAYEIRDAVSYRNCRSRSRRFSSFLSVSLSFSLFLSFRACMPELPMARFKRRLYLIFIYCHYYIFMCLFMRSVITVWLSCFACPLQCPRSLCDGHPKGGSFLSWAPSNLLHGTLKLRPDMPARANELFAAAKTHKQTSKLISPRQIDSASLWHSPSEPLATECTKCTKYICKSIVFEHIHVMFM